MAVHKTKRLSRFICILALVCFMNTACKPIKISNDKSLITLHNQARENGVRCDTLFKHKAPKLKWNHLLAKVALLHSQEMYTHKHLSHTNISGLGAGERMLAVGYQWNRYAENLAVGVYDDASVFELWLNSPAHCKNIANQNYTEMGAAQVNGYWTALYAKPE